jgi:hypothetical protein
MTSPQPPAPDTTLTTRRPPQTIQSASPRIPRQREWQTEQPRPRQPHRGNWGRFLTRMKLPGIRWQLTLWYTAMFLVVLLLAAGVAYTALKVTLDWQVDEALHSQAPRLAAGISDERGKLDPSECFIDGTFVVAKKEAHAWERATQRATRSCST